MELFFGYYILNYVKGLHFDGLWIDMNEPASFVAGRPGLDGGNQWQQERG